MKTLAPPHPRGYRCSNRPSLIGAMVLLMLGLLYPGPLLADVFHLKDGRTIEGSILRELGDLISIRSGSEVITIDRSQIVSIESSETVHDQYRKKAAELAPDDALGHLELALWCELEKLDAESRLHFTKVIGIVPDEPLARKKLGFEWIAGNWYLKNSPEAAEKRAELEKVGGDDAREIPAGLELGDWKKKVGKSKQPAPVGTPIRPRPGGGITVGLLLDERLERKAPDPSAVAFELNSASSKSDPSLSFRPVGKNSGSHYQLEVRIRCYFVRTQYFYKVPITDIFQGEAEATLYEALEGGGRKKISTTRVKEPFSWSSRQNRDKALDYTYYATIRHLVAKISRWSFLTQRGVEPLPFPDGDG